MTRLYGHPGATGPYTIALHVPPDTKIAAHTHRDGRTAIVVQGAWTFGYGRSANGPDVRTLGPGSFYVEPANLPHFARTGVEGATVYISGFGPSDTEYVE
ncbi:cupin domain-containing protein [Sphingopyxis sp. KK2]|uniref:cupin domain-containing protein n=1 Tax=Sphingopyxis sp. KK2 TaxID=1855727 RepID=UPI002117CBDB|nr:cupin domain-containing protein [Sphingopyxis sp. KK2]